jgi:hypothetical protein
VQFIEKIAIKLDYSREYMSIGKNKFLACLFIALLGMLFINDVFHGIPNRQIKNQIE